MITILMVIYNGERFVSEQIDSLLNQSVQDFKLLICDDKLTDRTFSIISEYANMHLDKIFIVQNKENSGSPK